MEENRTSIVAKFYKSIYSGDKGFSINLCTTKDINNLPVGVKINKGYGLITVLGNNIPDTESLLVRYYGEWKHSKRGIQFESDAFEVLIPETKSGMIHYLSSDLFPGIGVKTAERMVQTFGKDVLNVIRDTPAKLLTVKGINVEKMVRIVEAYKNSQSYAELSVFLADFGIGGEIPIRINEKYGAEAIDLIKKNPYQMMDVKGIGFKLADKIGKGLNIQLNSYLRISGCIIFKLTALCKATGNLYIPNEELMAHCLKELNEGINPAPVSEEVYNEVLTTMKERRKIVVRSNKYIYLKSYDDAEYNVTQKLLHLVETPIPENNCIYRTVNEYNDHSSVKLSEKQIEAVIKSLKNRVSIITGGPGTGKTTIIKCIIESYKKINGDVITCMAPTGKAARRMSEATGCKATTIHSRLGLYDGEANLEPNPIEEGLVIVDETSMVDNLLMEKLMSAISNRCQLIFIGDIDQLPSVGVGAVLGEMINSEVIPTSRLSEIFRQKDGGTIVDNAIRINCGIQEIEFNDNDFEFIEAKNESDALDTIQTLYTSEVDKYGIENVALLSPLRSTQKNRFKCVSDGLNPMLQDLLNPKQLNKPVARFGEKEFRFGDRVMCWKNGRYASNGDIGEVTAVYDDLEEYGMTFEVSWENGNIEQLHKEDAENITLAYSMSIHKSQGSEYDCVIIPLLSSQKCPLFKRNLLYTGITRAKKKVILVGDKRALSTCIQQSDTNKRNTLLSERLKYNAKKEK